MGVRQMVRLRNAVPNGNVRARRGTFKVRALVATLAVLGATLASSASSASRAYAACGSLPDVSSRMGRAQLFYRSPDYTSLSETRDVLWMNKDRANHPHRLSHGF